jgi:hypothetical protein
MIFNKRIYVSTEGGLGNQIFMWLNAKNFANANNSIIFFETLSGYIFGLNNPYNKKFKRYTKLKQFKNIKNNQSNLFISLIFIIIRIFNYFFKIKKVSSINLIFFRITVFNDLKLNFNKLKYQNYKQKKNEIILFIGYWQKSFFIKNFKENWIFLNNNSENKIQNFADKNINNKSVAIHIRGNERLWKKCKKNHPVPNLDFYKKSINYFKKKGIIFHIFTDDKKYAKKIIANLNLKKNFIYIDKYFKKDFEQFILLTKYKYYILPNSTFSLLPSIISKYKGKIIFLSNLWYKRKKLPKDLRVKSLRII